MNPAEDQRRPQAPEILALLLLWLRIGLIRIILQVQRVLLPRAEDLDQLFPWLLAATGIVGSSLLVFLLFSPAVFSTHHRLRAHDSRIEITLAPLPRHPQFHPNADIPSLARGPGTANSAERPQSVPKSDKERELAAYLLLWQQHILALGKAQLTQAKLPTGKIVVAVTIAASGQLVRLQILQGEQNHALAMAVREIVYTAAPFPALPSAWQSPPQNLRIIRTWNFH